jgi:hypothetical protein
VIQLFKILLKKLYLLLKEVKKKKEFKPTLLLNPLLNRILSLILFKNVRAFRPNAVSQIKALSTIDLRTVQLSLVCV